MFSPNKKAPTVAERQHMARIKEMPCVVCDAPGPSEAHEPEQGLYHLVIPLCPDCHRGSFNGLHGQRRIWKAKKMTELDAMNETIRRLVA